MTVLCRPVPASPSHSLCAAPGGLLRRALALSESSLELPSEAQARAECLLLEPAVHDQERLPLGPEWSGLCSRRAAGGWCVCRPWELSFRATGELRIDEDGGQKGGSVSRLHHRISERTVQC